jgi:hypothetical protein
MGKSRIPYESKRFETWSDIRKLFDFNGFAIALIPAFPNARPRSIGKHAAGAIQQNRNRGWSRLFSKAQVRIPNGIW